MYDSGQKKRYCSSCRPICHVMIRSVKNLGLTPIRPLACLFNKKFLFVAALVLFICAPAAAADHLQDAANAFERGDVVAAETILALVLHGQPKDGPALGLLAVVLDTQKKYSEADGIYRRALAVTPNSASLLNNFGNHQLATGDAIAARKTFLKVVALRPDHSNATLQLAAMAADQNNGLESLHYLNRLGTSEASTPQFVLLRMRAL